MKLKMASNQTNLVENLKQLITELITNLITATLQVLETSGVVTFDALADIFETDPRFTQFVPQLLQILEENGIETEALVNASNTARSQSSSDTGIQESMDNLRQQAEEFFTDARILELAQELKETLRIYYEGIHNHESLRVNSPEFFEFLYSIPGGYLPFLAPLLLSDPEFTAELVRFLTKFLDVEAAINNQQN